MVLASQRTSRGTSLVVQWLRLHSSSIRDMGSIPVGGTKIWHAGRKGKKFLTKKSNSKKASMAEGWRVQFKG